MRILGIVIIVVTLGFLGGYGVLREFNSTEDKPSIPQTEMIHMKKHFEKITNDNDDEASRANHRHRQNKMPLANNLSEEDAELIAIEDANLQLGEVHNMRVKEDYYHGINVYDIDFFTDNTEYNYKINADNGDILFAEYEVDKDYVKQLRNKPISKQEAINLVLKKIPGATGSDITIKQQRDNNRLEYECMVHYKNAKYEATIDTNSGKIIDWEMDTD